MTRYNWFLLFLGFVILFSCPFVPYFPIVVQRIVGAVMIIYCVGLVFWQHKDRGIKELKMSYEGCEQRLCENGHYSIADAYDSFRDNLDVIGCSECKAPMVWFNCVDTTNGSYETNPDTGLEERIDGYVELEIDKPAEMCVCHCGHQHVVGLATYKIPQDKGHLIPKR